MPRQSSLQFKSKPLIYKYWAILIAILLPFLFYGGSFFGRSFGLECAGSGVMGTNPPFQQAISFNNPYCLDISDIGAYSWQHFPQWVKTSQEYLNFKVPLWNQNSGVGVPLAANFISSVFFIPVILFSIPKSIFIFDLFFILRFSVASLGIYLFLRTFKISKPICLIGSLVMFLNGYFTYIPTIVHVNVDILLPWVAYFINKSHQEQRVKYFFGFATVLALSNLGSFPESNVFIGLFSGIYILFLLFLSKGNQKNRLFFAYFISGLLGFSFSALLLLPGFEYLKLSSNLHLPGNSQSYSIPLWSIFSWAFPKLFGSLQDTGRVMQTHNLPWSGNYIGAFSFFILLAAPSLILFERVKLKKIDYSKFYYFFLIFLIFLIASYYQIVPNVFAKLPFFSQVNFVKYSQTLIVFLAATVAAFTLNYLLIFKSKKTLLFSLFCFFGIALIAYLKFSSFTVSESAYYRAPMSLAFNLQLLLSFTTVATATLTIFLFLFKKVSKKTVLLTLLIIAGVELFFYVPIVGNFQRKDSFRKPPFVDFLKSRDYRESRIFSPDYILYPDSSAIFNLNDVRNLDALWPKNYYEYIREFVSPDADKAAFRFTGFQENGTSKLNHFINNPYFDILSVKYLLTYNKIEHFSEIERLAPFIEQKDLLPTRNFEINKINRTVVFEHAPGKLEINLEKPKGSKFLTLFPALSQEVFNDTSKGDGVKFTATLFDQKTQIAKQEIILDPKNKKEDQRWAEIRIGPIPDETSRIKLILETDALMTNIFDWSGWGGFEWDNQIQIPSNTRYQKIYDKEIKIYENKNFIPRLNPVEKVKCVNKEADIFPAMKKLNTEIETTAIVIGRKCLNKTYSKIIQIKNQNFDDHKVSFKYTANTETFVTLSNLFYPGWKLLVDGKEIPIERANYIFQGLRLPANQNSTVELVYDPQSFKIGLAITLLSLIFSGIITWKFGNRKIDSWHFKV